MAAAGIDETTRTGVDTAAQARSRARDRYLAIRTMIETPVLDDRKWAKIPSIPADAILVDMEDAVPWTQKEEGRAAVVAALADRAHFGDRVVIARPNHLSTRWGLDDVVALAQAGAECVMYPMARSVGDIVELRRLFREHGASPDLIICIETAAAVGVVEEIAAQPDVVALSFGEGDLTADMGVPIFMPDGSINPMVTTARARTAMAARANGLALLDLGFLHNIRDLDECRERSRGLLDLGATGLVALYPPHVEVHLDLFRPSDEELAAAQEVVEHMEAAVARGEPAVQLPSGRTLLIHDYHKAQRVLARAGAQT